MVSVFRGFAELHGLVIWGLLGGVMVLLEV